jgi:hypothetical protein
METEERPPPMSETLMVVPLGGADGDSGAPTTYVRDVDGGTLGGTDGDPGASTTYVGGVDGGPPWEALMETREHPPPMSETSMVGP